MSEQPKDLELHRGMTPEQQMEAVAEYLSAALETGEFPRISHAIGVVVKAQGIGKVADRAGMAREQLYRCFSVNGNPTLRTLLRITKALGVQMSAKTAPGTGDDQTTLKPGLTR